MFWPITGTAGGDLGLLIEEIVPEIRAAQTLVDTCESLEVCDQAATYTCDDGKVYCADHVPDNVTCWEFS